MRLFSLPEAEDGILFTDVAFRLVFGGLSSGEPEDGRYSRASWEAGGVDVFFLLLLATPQWLG